MPKKIDKIDEALEKIRSRKILKDSEERKIASEVFDQQTLQTLYKIANKGYIEVLNGVISTGKEANVFKGFVNSDIVAVKIYRIATSDFRKMENYILGDPRFDVRMSNRRQIVYTWVKKEYSNLKRAYKAKVRVPKPITSRNNVLVMEFIGDKYGNPAPTLRELPPDDPDKTFEKIILYYKRLYNDAKLVHGDFSTFNILNLDGEPVIIDLSQAVVVDHPLSMELLNRDIHNIVNDFRKLGVKTSFDEVKNMILD
ncbi:RIO-like kinase [Methanothermus fervidus DSM 2088]|uniref:non-specific serine/threonine protein kinase n=1 Tax=Methanothermus fervidus (strain ATCC 43054 / DSM 2088 / JCM 10308 / V24 S) TaxID=523846 RepID=E3GXR5_METFV|nr:serine protein kinase RIO [Methanothermus fervidus]ADP77097.1 RIO-like kinase [Methanothermus fervidus DSM 2088]